MRTTALKDALSACKDKFSTECYFNLIDRLLQSLSRSADGPLGSCGNLKAETAGFYCCHCFMCFMNAITIRNLSVHHRYVVPTVQKCRKI